MEVFHTLAPIVALTALGAVLRRTGFCSEAFFREGNKVVFWVGIPSLLFQKSASSVGLLAEAGRVSAVLVVALAACLLCGLVVGRALGLARPSLAAFVQAAFRGNLAYVGLPVVLLALRGAADARLEAVMVLAIVPVVPLYNLAAVVVLLAARPPDGASLGARARTVLFRILTNPLVVSGVAGLLYGAVGLGLPPAVDRTLESLGQMSLPLALLGLGAGLRLRALRGDLRVSLAATALKLVLCPLVGGATALAIGLSPQELRVALVFLATPTAVMSYVMAEAMGADAPLTARIVVLSTVLSLPVLALILALT